MVAFRRKKIRGTETLGELLAMNRKEEGLTRASLSEQLHIPEHFLEAIEEDRYDQLPEGLYARRFLEKYAQALTLPLDRVLELYEKEVRVTVPQQKKRLASLFSPQKLPKAILTPRIIRAGSTGLGVLALLLYIGTQVAHIMEPPALMVNPENSNLVLQDHSIVIEGVTDPEAEVMINNKEVVGTQEGHFSETIQLNKGVNILEITAKKKRSDTTTVYRKILVES